MKDINATHGLMLTQRQAWRLTSQLEVGCLEAYLHFCQSPILLKYSDRQIGRMDFGRQAIPHTHMQ